MRRSNYILNGLIALSIIISSAEARSKRVNQIPNGNVFKCANCHIDPNGGGTRTAFGQVIEFNYLNPSGDVTWNQALALNDADGDGVTNGQELLDPTGTWTIGVSNPGTSSLVTNPGDPNSITKVDLITGSNPQTYSLDQNYPNPFNPTTNISFEIAKAGNVELRVYNSLGQVVKTLANDIYEPGKYQVQWDGLDESGQSLSSGIYFYRLGADIFSQTRRMMYLR